MTEFPPQANIRWERSGFTLIEVLAVVVLLAVISTLSIAGLSSTSAGASLMRLKAECRNLDAHARLAAQSSGKPMTIQHKQDANLIELLEDTDSERLSIVSWPAALTLRMEIGGVPASTVVLDRLGRSPDYSFIILRDQHESRLDIAGLTGAVSAHEMESTP